MHLMLSLPTGLELLALGKVAQAKSISIKVSYTLEARVHRPTPKRAPFT